MANDSIWSDISDDDLGSLGSFSSLSDDDPVIIRPKSKSKSKRKSDPKIISPKAQPQSASFTKKESSSNNKKKSNSNTPNNQSKEKMEDNTIQKLSQESISQKEQLQTLKAKIEINRENNDPVGSASVPNSKKNIDPVVWKSSSPMAGSASKLSPTSTATQLPEPVSQQNIQPKKSSSIPISNNGSQESSTKEQIILKVESVTPSPMPTPIASPQVKRLIPFPSSNKISPTNEIDTSPSSPEAISPKRSSTVLPVKTIARTVSSENNNTITTASSKTTTDFPSSKQPKVLLGEGSKQVSTTTATLSSSMLLEPERSARSAASSSNTVESHQAFTPAHLTTLSAPLAPVPSSIQHRDTNASNSGSVTATVTAPDDKNGLVTGFCRAIKVNSHLNAIRFVRGKVPKLLCASSDSTIQIFNLKGEQISALQGHTDRVVSLAISNPFYTMERTSQATAAGGGEKVLKLLAVSGSRDEHVRLWDLDNGQCLHSIHAHKSPIWSVSVIVRPNSDIIIISTGLDGTMKSWDGKTGKRLCNFKGHTDKILSVTVYNPTGEHPVLFSGGGDKLIKAWDLLTGQHIRMFDGHDAEIHTVVAEGFTGFSSLVPVGGGNGGDATNNQQYVGGANKTLVIVSASNDLTIRVWEFLTGFLLFELMGHSSNIYEVSIVRAPEPPPKRDDHAVPKGTPLVVSCSDDGSIRVWNITNGKLVKTHKWHKVITRSLDTAVFPMSLYTALHAIPPTTTASTTTPAIDIPPEYAQVRQETLIATAGWDKTVQLHSLTEAIYGNGTRSSCTIS